jgi:RNA polymerase sigma factor (sigma-70 family)
VRTLLVADAADALRAPDGAGPGDSDAELVRAVAGGDPSALGRLYDRYGRAAYSLARRICVDDGLAEEVVQEVFLAFWRDPLRFDPQRGSFSAWLLTLVHHKSVDAVRRESTVRRRTVSATAAADDLFTPGPAADDPALGAIVAGQVRDALGSLPPEQRHALALAYFGGYTQREVAVLTGVPLGTVKSRMFAGVQRMRAVLGPLLGDVSTDKGRGAG